ncbi:hypothetical protein [Kitasatospora sp. NPDC088783]
MTSHSVAAGADRLLPRDFRGRTASFAGSFPAGLRQRVLDDWTASSFPAH